MPRGFSANFILLLWYLCGGVCLWGFEGNILALMFRPVYEDPVDSVQDIIDRGLIPLIWPRGQGLVLSLAQSDNHLYKDLAKVAEVAKDIKEYLYKIRYHVQGNGTHVLYSNHISDNMAKYGLYHFSQERIEGDSPYGVWINNKMWHLRDELAKHILIYQQVC
jgi:hypothetical protein